MAPSLRVFASSPEKFQVAQPGMNETSSEVMSSPAACRTYNVLLSEGRRVGLALLPVVEAP